MKQILIIDDDAATVAGLADVVESWGYEPRTAGTLDEGRRELDRLIPDLLILDLQLPDGTGLELLEELRADLPDLPVIMLTGHATVDTAVSALKTGAEDFAAKPVDLVRLRVSLETIAEKGALRDEVLALRRELQKLGTMGRLVGKTDAMQTLYKEIELVARTDASVFIVGESGTGKEVVAQTVHELSKRSKKPFVAFNCGAISATLIESEIFGHEKGAFTNAEKRRIGYFESAKGGTIFLDEITEMPLELQVKLLRVLEESRFRRVGGNDEIQIDARIVAATNRDPKAAIAEGKLREDLYYRLCVFPLEIPPLRERTPDIPLLAMHFLDQLNQAEGREVESIAPSVLEALADYDFPGNVRELRNVLHRAFVVTQGSSIELSALPSNLKKDRAAKSPAKKAAKKSTRKSTATTRKRK